jgi:hypothetical protein
VIWNDLSNLSSCVAVKLEHGVGKFMGDKPSPLKLEHLPDRPGEPPGQQAAHPESPAMCKKISLFRVADASGLSHPWQRSSRKRKYR